MNYIYNETLSWVVDGVNKTFTTVYDIFKIEEVYIGWAAYRGVSFSWNTVVFNDAPPLWSPQPSIDYFETTTPVPAAEWDVTLGLIINDVYDKLVQDRFTGGVPNDVYKEGQIRQSIVTGWRRIKNKRAQLSAVSSYSFRKAKDFLTNNEDWGQIEIGEQTNIPASWFIALDNWAVIEYNSYTWWTVFTAWWVWKIGTRFSFWYKLPSVAAKPSEVMINWAVLEYEDQREWTASSKWYTLIDDYIFLPLTNRNDIVVIKYIKKHQVITEDADIIPVEWDYFEMLSYFALYKVCQLVEDERWFAFKAEWKEIEKEWRSYRSRSVDWINNTLRSSILNNIK